MIHVHVHEIETIHCSNNKDTFDLLMFAIYDAVRIQAELRCSSAYSYNL